MRITLTYIAVIAFALIGIVGLVEGNYKIGVATMCLALANGLLLL
jgi:hypothetical protein